MPQFGLITPAQAMRLIGTPEAPTIIDVRTDEDIAALPRMVPTARHISHRQIATLTDPPGRAIVVCTNTMHLVAPAIEAAVDIPLLHIADATAQRIRAAGLTRVALLGTRFTMEQAFYRERIEAAGIAVLTPDATQRERVHRVIYDELCQGRIVDTSRDDYRAIMADLVARGAQGVILGCTEIGLLVGAGDASVPLFDTARIHAEAAADWAVA